MEDTNEILEAIASLSVAIGDLRSCMDTKLDAITERLTSAETKISRTRKTVSAQAEDIERIYRRLEQLEGTKAEVYRSRDGRRLGLEKTAAYNAIEDLGYSPRKALRYLDEGNRLICNGSGKTRKRTAVVWTKDGTLRAVVIRMNIE